MIGKGNLHADGGYLADYMRDRGRGEIIDKRGFLADDLREAFCTIQAIAESQTRCEKPFFHTYVRLPPGENLRPEQWLAIADRFERALGFDDQPRAVVMHTDAQGDRHMHVAWSRIDTEQMCAIDPGLYKNKMRELCRELELDYGLQVVTSDRRPEQQTRAANRAEFDEARRLGVDIEEVREAIRACYDQSDNGASFAAALSEYGLGLARGDRRDFVVIDPEGGQHALGNRICGATASEIRKRLGDRFKAGLPTVDAMKADMAAWKQARQDRGERAMTEAPSDDQYAAQHQRESAQLQELADQDRRLQEFKRQREADAEEARKQEKERRQADERRAADGEIASARDRYAQALGQHYEVRDPYASLARAAMAEYGTFKRQQEELRKEILKAKDPEQREALQLRQRIEGCEYMAVTSRRLAGISAAIAGREDSPIAVRDREQAKAWQDQADKLREQRAQQQADREKQGREQVAERLGDLRRGIEKGDRDGETTDAKATRISRAAQTDGGKQPGPTMPRSGGRGGR